MQNTQVINWWLEIAKIAVPSLIALVVPILTGFVLARKMKDYESNLSADLKSYELSLNRKLEEYKNQLSDKRARMQLVMDKLDSLYVKVSEFRSVCTDYAGEVLLMSVNGYEMDEYQKLVRITTSIIAEMDSKIGLYAREAYNEFSELITTVGQFKNACSQYLEKKGEFENVKNSLNLVLENCTKVLNVIEAKSSEYLDVGK